MGGPGSGETGFLSPFWCLLATGPLLIFPICGLGIYYWSVSEDVSSASSDASYTRGKFRGSGSALKEPVTLVTQCAREWCQGTRFTDGLCSLPCSAFRKKALRRQARLKFIRKYVREDSSFPHRCLLPSCRLYLGKVPLEFVSRM